MARLPWYISRIKLDPAQKKQGYLQLKMRVRRWAWPALLVMAVWRYRRELWRGLRLQWR
jgi:hypothetical protein